MGDNYYYKIDKKFVKAKMVRKSLQLMCHGLLQICTFLLERIY